MPKRHPGRMAVAINFLATILERLMRRRIKRMIYKRLYGGRWTRRDALCCALYRRLPNAHPLVLTTLEGR